MCTDERCRHPYTCDCAKQCAPIQEDVTMPDRLPFDRWAIVEAAYIFAEAVPPEQGDPIRERVKALGYLPSLSVQLAAKHAWHGEPVGHCLDRTDYAVTRAYLARLLRRLRHSHLCEGCYCYVPEVVTVIAHRADPEAGPTPHDHWEEHYCPTCHANLTK